MNLIKQQYIQLFAIFTENKQCSYKLFPNSNQFYSGSESARYDNLPIETDYDTVDVATSGHDTDSDVSLGYNVKKSDDRVLSWHNIEYMVNDKQILHGISGHIIKGQLLGILGHSGAGKTSLLRALSGRQTAGQLSGEIFHNGHQVTNVLKLKELCGYVPQDNILCPTSTARECIEFSAALRLPPHASDKQKQQSINSVISSLKLSHCGNTKVGTEFKTGLSGGEAKRVSIGIELVTNPQLLVLDEPTSGLDSYTALQTMKILKTLTKNYNKQCILTIHQPSSEMFNMFDKLILMTKGHCVYFGCSTNVVHYFKLLGYHCSNMVNFSDFILHSIQDDPDFFISAWKQFNFDPIKGFSDSYALIPIIMEQNTSHNENENNSAAIIQSDRKRCCFNIPSAPFTKQIYMLVTRDVIGLYRDPFCIMARMLNVATASALLSLLYWDLPLTMRGAQDLGSFIFFLSTHCLLSGVTYALQTFPKTRILYEHERSSKMYSTTAYMLSKLIHNTTFILFESVIISFLSTRGVFYSNWNSNIWKHFWLVLFLGASASGAYGVLIGCWLKGLSEAMSAPPIFTPMIILNNISADMTRVFAFIRWLRLINFSNYMLDALFQSAFIQKTIMMSPLMVISGEEYLNYLNVGADTFSYNVAMVACFICVFWFVSWIVLVNRNGF